MIGNPEGYICYFRQVWPILVGYFDYNSFMQKNCHLFIYLYMPQVYNGTVLSAGDIVVNKTEMVSAFMGDLMLNITHANSHLGLR